MNKTNPYDDLYKIQNIISGYPYDVYPILSESTDRLFEFIKKNEQNGVWIQHIPCNIILSRTQIDHCVTLAIIAFINKTNIAKKLNLELLLRITLKRQIKHAIDMINNVSDKYFWLAIIDPTYKNPRIHFENGIAQQYFKILDPKLCSPDINLIEKVYDIDTAMLNNQCEKRRLKTHQCLLRLIIEKINTMIF